MSWAQLLLIVMSYCMSGANQQIGIKAQNQCRNDKMTCVKRVTSFQPELKTAQNQVDREMYLVNGCLDDSNFKAAPVDPSLIKIVTAPTPPIKH